MVSFLTNYSLNNRHISWSMDYCELSRARSKSFGFARLVSSIRNKNVPNFNSDLYIISIHYDRDREIGDGAVGDHYV